MLWTRAQAQAGAPMVVTVPALPVAPVLALALALVRALALARAPAKHLLRLALLMGGSRRWNFKTCATCTTSRGVYVVRLARCVRWCACACAGRGGGAGDLTVISPSRCQCGDFGELFQRQAQETLRQINAGGVCGAVASAALRATCEAIAALHVRVTELEDRELCYTLYRYKCRAVLPGIRATLTKPRALCATPRTVCALRMPLPADFRGT